MLINEELNNIKYNSIDNLLLGAHKRFTFNAIKRAIADFRDGLIPVYRRLLFSMYELNLKNFVKSIRIIGYTAGKFHPHGELSLYGALVKLNQSFYFNVLFTVPQGNFGGIEGSKPAAARYTETRLDPDKSKLLFDNLREETIEWNRNFDNSADEPAILPTIIPLALINGTFGIGVGAMGLTPPHNFNEVLNALIFCLKNDSFDLKDLLNFIKGPDFPTGGKVTINDLYEFYDLTRKNSFCVQGNIEFEDNSLIITEVPYGVKLKAILQELNYLRKEKIFELREICDESDINNIRIKINLSNNASKEIVKAEILKNTSLTRHFPFSMLFLEDQTLVKFNLFEFFRKFTNYLIFIYKKKMSYRQSILKSEIKLCNLNLWIIDNLNDILIILKSKDLSIIEIKNKLALMKLNSEEIDYILSMRLSKICHFEETITKKRLSESLEQLKEIELALKDISVLKNYIINDLSKINKKIFIPRKTKIACGEIESSPDINVILCLIESRFVVKILETQVNLKKLASKSVNINFNLGNPNLILRANNLDKVFFFGSKGTLLKKNVDRIKMHNASYKSLTDYFDLQSDLREKEVISCGILINNNDFLMNEFDTVVFVTKKGFIAKIKLSVFQKISNKTKFLKYRDQDSLFTVFLAKSNQDIFIISKKGKLVCFNLSEIRYTSKNVSGVKGMILAKDDFVVASNSKLSSTLFIFTKKGLAKGIDMLEISKTHRSTKGVSSINLVNDYVADALVTNDTEFILLTNKGNLLKCKLEQINFYKRAAKGHKAILLKDNESVVKIV